MPNKSVNKTPKEMAELIEAATAPLRATIEDLQTEKARTHAALVAARTAIHQGALRLPYPGKFGLQTILSNMDKAIKGDYE